MSSNALTSGCEFSLECEPFLPMRLKLTPETEITQQNKLRISNIQVMECAEIRLNGELQLKVKIIECEDHDPISSGQLINPAISYYHCLNECIT